MEQNTKSLADCLDLVYRRKYYLVVTWLVVSLTSLMIAYNLPKVYRSTATILIEAPIPTKLFESTVSQFADEQIQSIYQRVMTTDNVLSIIDSNGLYKNTDKDFTNIKNDSAQYELAELFRKNTEVKLTTSSLAPQTHSGMAEIAFDISFSDIEAIKAQEIASKLTTLFIEQNDKARTQRAVKATDFLMEESEKLSRELQEIDRKIAQYKQQNNFSLPEQVQGNLAAIDRAENELRDTDNQIRSTKERIAFLSAELARAQQNLPGSLDSKAPQSRDDALRIMRAQYLKFSSIYSPSHPSVLRLKREIKALDPAFEGQSTTEDLVNQLTEAKRELKVLEKTYADNHPDINLRRKQIDKLQQQLKNTSQPSKQELESMLIHTTNPAYYGVEQQYKSSQLELNLLKEKQDYLKAKVEKMQAMLLEAPQVEMGYTDLIRDRDNAIKKYTQLKEKWLDAKLVQTLEQQQQGQTLTIIEQPTLPTHPEKAIRRKVAIGGIFIGLIAGFGVAFLVEFITPGIRGYRAISEITGLMPLVVIPYIEAPFELAERLVKQAKMKKIMVWTGVTLILLTTVVICIYSIPLAETFLRSN
ncbi:lipopolysaccharide biosynthesis protein [Methylobacter sp. S3L5C]|uniref:GumC family protein n=1 Tax=Methylobacter sp. S3L5C TaxID=2839024 RepID=UPI001FAC6A06|nr:lipopolysaccharide biosynthesis protein [Methylobacter sp. S3L5C]UOA10205.1 lipopolysaccharide biosynthesis protein [Methylobacter sp. S3L5C]